MATILKMVEYLKRSVEVPESDSEKVIEEYTTRGWCYCDCVTGENNSVILTFSIDMWQETLVDGKMVYEDLRGD
jgi:hypothetical protein